MQETDRLPSNRQSRQCLQPLGKPIRFSESYKHSRDSREPTEPDPWFEAIPSKVGIIDAKPSAIASPTLLPPATPLGTSVIRFEPEMPLIPLQSSWRDGQRYRLAPAIEWPARLDLFIEDASVQWIRRSGVLIAIA